MTKPKVKSFCVFATAQGFILLGGVQQPINHSLRGKTLKHQLTHWFRESDVGWILMGPENCIPQNSHQTAPSYFQNIWKKTGRESTSSKWIKWWVFHHLKPPSIQKKIADFHPPPAPPKKKHHVEKKWVFPPKKSSSEPAFNNSSCWAKRPSREGLRVKPPEVGTR